MKTSKKEGKNVTGEGGHSVQPFQTKEKRTGSHEARPLLNVESASDRFDLLQAPLSTRLNFQDMYSVVSAFAGIASLSLATLTSSDFGDSVFVP
jgi:hypothetical protein